MLPMLFVAYIPALLATTVADSSESGQGIARSAQNGEFIAAHYPPGALKRGEQGKVAFRLTIEPNGKVGTCDVTESSGFAAVDNETCDIMVQYAQLEPVRNMDGRAIRATQSGYIVWKLPQGTTAVASTSAKRMPKPNKLICREDITTGSLIKKTRQCMTAPDWKEQQQMWKDEVDRIQGKGHADQIPSGN